VELINQLARETGFVKRARKLLAFNFVNTLMFSFCNQANTSLPDIVADLNQQFDVDISKEGLHKKFSAQAVVFLKELIKYQLSKQLSLQADSELNKHFTSVTIKDSSKFYLPSTYNGDYPGFGNFSKTNGLMNLQYEYDLVNGNWIALELTTIKTNDQQDSKQSIGTIEKGGFYLRDLGYITPTYLKGVIEKGASFLNRMPPQINVHTPDKKPIDWQKIANKFNKTGAGALDMDVLIYKKELLECRLVIERVTGDEYRKRLKHAEQSAKKHGVGLSKERKFKCRYNLFITNVDRTILPIEKIKKTYYLRWQIELVFKTWKSFFEINKVKKVKKERMECQLLAKLLWILLNLRLCWCCVKGVAGRFTNKQTELGVNLLQNKEMIVKECGFKYIQHEGW